MSNIKCVIFDFDYTLADSSRGAIECTSYALEKLGFSVPSEEAIKKAIGLSLSGTFDALAGEMASPPHDEFSRFFVELADKVMLDRIVLFDEVRPMIKELLSKGLLLGIVSTKFRYRIKAFFERESLNSAFSVIIGGEDTDVHKPDPKGLFMAIEKMKCAPEEIIYVGDSITDAETAKRAGVAFVATLTGVTPGEAFNEYKPLSIIQDLSGIGELV